MAVSVAQVLFLLLVLVLVALAALVTIWIWRDMQQRGRPKWLRIVVIVAQFVTGWVGLLVWLIDLRRHPHKLGLTRSDIIRQRFRAS